MFVLHRIVLMPLTPQPATPMNVSLIVDTQRIYTVNRIDRNVRDCQLVVSTGTKRQTPLVSDLAKRIYTGSYVLRWMEGRREREKRHEGGCSGW